MHWTSRVVLHPRKKNSLHDICVVVPCYDEGQKVLDTIYSVAIDAQRTNSRIAIFLVVNNKQDCNPAILSENKLTAKLVIDIIRWKELWHKKVSWYTYQQRIKIDRVRKSWITLWLVDCYSERNAPRECNVWYARDVWTRSILSYLGDDNSVIAHTDADCKVLTGFFNAIYDTYHNSDEEINISRWHTRFTFLPWEEMVKERIFWVEEFERHMCIFQDSDKLSLWQKWEKWFFTPWANHQYRRSMFNKIGGYYHLSWAEDVLLWMKAQVLWYPVHKIPAIISTQCRFSERTQEGHWFWFEMKRKGSENISCTQTETIEYHRDLWICLDILQDAHLSDDFSSFLDESSLEEILSSSVVARLKEIYKSYSWYDIDDMKKYHITWILVFLHSTLKQELLKKHPRKKIFQVLTDVIHVIDNDEIFKKFTDRFHLNNINSIHLRSPSSEESHLLDWYCRLAKEKLKVYIMLKKVIDYFSILWLVFTEILKNNQQTICLDNRDIDLQELFIKIIWLLRVYWEKLILNTLAEFASWKDLINIISEIDNMFESSLNEESIKDIRVLSDDIEKLNTHAWVCIPHFWDALDLWELFKRYVIEN